MIIIDSETVSSSLLLSAGAEGWEGHLHSVGRELYKALQKVSKGFPGEISGNPLCCWLAQCFKQVIFPQQTAVNAHCQYVQINISGETDKDIMAHVSSQIHCVLFPAFFFLCFIRQGNSDKALKKGTSECKWGVKLLWFFSQLFGPSQVLLHGIIAQWWGVYSEEIVSTSALTIWP